MSYLIAFICALVSLPLCITSFIIAEKRIHKARLEAQTKSEAVSSDPASDDTGELASDITDPYEGLTSAKQFTLKLTSLTISQIIIMVMAFVIVGFAVYRVLELQLLWTRLLRMILPVGVLLVAAIIDLYTKKIPNYLPVTLMGISVSFLIIEFIRYRAEFKDSVLACMCGAVVFFIVLFLISVVTGGGFGLGDVKLITAVTMVCGASLSIYTLTLGLMVCMLVSVALLVTKRGKIKDEIPFGPFIFVGYALSLMFGLL